MTEKEQRIEHLRDKLIDIIDAATEDSFDERRLNEVLAELASLDPVPQITDEEAREKLREFKAHRLSEHSVLGERVAEDGIKNIWKRPS